VEESVNDAIPAPEKTIWLSLFIPRDLYGRSTFENEKGGVIVLIKAPFEAERIMIFPPSLT
jgi:hypothetical protein